jgi:hypothetical protein
MGDCLKTSLLEETEKEKVGDDKTTHREVNTVNHSLNPPQNVHFR